MKALQMSKEEVMTQLAGWGSEKSRATLARMGAGENQFGVMLGKLRELAKKLKTNHALAMELWATGNTDAMLLATMIMAGDQLAREEVEDMLRPLTYIRLVDEFAYSVAAKTPFAGDLREQWIHSPEEFTGRAGWNLMIAAVTGGSPDGVDVDAVLRLLEAEMLSAPKRKQEVMNRCLVEIGVHIPGYTQTCIEIGERLGRFDKTPTPKGCVSSYAPEWIAAVLKRQNIKVIYQG